MSKMTEKEQEEQYLRHIGQDGQGELVNYCRRFVGDDAEDIAHDVFLEATKDYDPEKGGTFRTFLYQKAEWRCLDFQCKTPKTNTNISRLDDPGSDEDQAQKSGRIDYADLPAGFDIDRGKGAKYDEEAWEGWQGRVRDSQMFREMRNKDPGCIPPYPDPLEPLNAREVEIVSRLAEKEDREVIRRELGIKSAHALESAVSLIKKKMRGAGRGSEVSFSYTYTKREDNPSGYSPTEILQNIHKSRRRHSEGSNIPFLRPVGWGKGSKKILAKRGGQQMPGWNRNQPQDAGTFSMGLDGVSASGDYYNKMADENRQKRFRDWSNCYPEESNAFITELTAEHRNQLLKDIESFAKSLVSKGELPRKYGRR